jgi:LCP family protein required for cell wall assembly
MKRKVPFRKWIVLLTLAIILTAGVFTLWNESLFGKQLPNFMELSESHVTPRVTGALPRSTKEVVVETSNSLEATNVPMTPMTLATPTSEPANVSPVCGQTKPMILLGLGIDENEQADVIRIVRVDFAERKILILSIPRDFWVPIPGMSDHNITEFKINAAYGFGEYYDGPGQGVVEFSKTIYQNYGVAFDHYVVFHFTNFQQMIDAVGGVDVVLDAPIGAYGVTGKTHLDGATALDYARNRDADNDNYRIERQSEIIKGLYGKMVQPENIVKIPALGLKFLSDKTLLTDLSLRDIATFTCMAKEISKSSLAFKDIPSNLYTPAHTNTGRFVDLPSPEVTSYIQELVLNGNY